MPTSLFANTLRLCPSLKLTDQLSPPYKQDYGWPRYKLHVLEYQEAKQKVVSSVAADFSQNESALNYNKHAIFLFENNFVKYVYFTTFSRDLLAIVRPRFCQTFYLRFVNIRVHTVSWHFKVIVFTGYCRIYSVLLYSIYILASNLTPSA